jgi:hypothetical protein
MLAQKIISNTEPPFWDGIWKSAFHRFVSFQIIKDGEVFNGWIKISFNMSAEKLILHRAAICRKPYKTVRAGEL